MPRIKQKKLGPLGEFLQTLENYNEAMDNARISIQDHLSNHASSSGDRELSKEESIAADIAYGLDWQFSGTESYEDVKSTISRARRKYKKVIESETRRANRRAR